jgi:hypothetical protein
MGPAGSKRGQLTLFIATGLVIVLVVGLLLYSQGPSKLLGVASPADMNKVTGTVNDCLRSSATQGLKVVGSHGGYRASQQGMENTSFFASEGVQSMPELSTIETELSRYVEENIGTCGLGTLVDYSIVAERPSVTTSILDGTARIVAAYHLTVTQGASVTRLDSFAVSVPSNMFKLYTASRQMVAEHMKDPQVIPMSRFLDVALTENVTFSTVENDAGDVAITLHDQAPSYSEWPELGNGTQDFSFALRCKK